MVFYIKQSHGRGKRISVESISLLEKTGDYETVEVDVPDFWEGRGIIWDASPPGVRRVIPEDFYINSEEVPFSSPLGESSRHIRRSQSILQEGRSLVRSRDAHARARQAIRLGRDQVNDRDWSF